jgi:hypothetical protein
MSGVAGLDPNQPWPHIVSDSSGDDDENYAS